MHPESGRNTPHIVVKQTARVSEPPAWSRIRKLGGMSHLVVSPVMEKPVRPTSRAMPVFLSISIR